MRVVGAELEADRGGTAQRVAALDLAPDAVDRLVNGWLPLADLAGGRAQAQVAVLIERRRVNALEVERDGPGVGAGLDDDVVLEGPRAPIVLDVDARVDLGIADPRVRWDGSMLARGIVAKQVAAAAGQLVSRGAGRRGVRAQEAHAHGCGFRGSLG